LIKGPIFLTRVLKLELGDLKKKLVSTENKWQVGKGLTK
jgi:hypothetical protein